MSILIPRVRLGGCNGRRFFSTMDIMTDTGCEAQRCDDEHFAPLRTEDTINGGCIFMNDQRRGLTPEQFKNYRQVVATLRRNIAERGQVSFYRPMEKKKDTFSRWVKTPANGDGMSLDAVAEVVARMDLQVVPAAARTLGQNEVAMERGQLAGLYYSAVEGIHAQGEQLARSGVPVKLDFINGDEGIAA